jgi:hypothetical protein
MALELVPHEHIAHLLARSLDKKKASGADREDWEARLLSTDSNNLVEIRNYIEGAFKGTTAHLDRIWIFRGQRAALGWRLPYLRGVDVKTALGKHLGLARRVGRPATWTDVDAKSFDKARVVRARVDSDEIEIIVRIKKKIGVTNEGEHETHEKTEDVSLRITFGGNPIPMCIVFATLQDARRATFCALDWLRDVRTPRSKSDEQQKVMEPLFFRESDLEAVSSSLSWGNPTQVRGMDATGECGDVTYSGHKEGHDLGELDAEVPKVQAQLETANAIRRYKIAFTHQDDYEEVFQTSFHLQGVQARLQFHQRTSLSAMDFVIARIRAQVGV